MEIPKEALCRTYGTMLTFNEKLKIHFETDVAMLGEFEQEGFLYFVNKKQAYINNREPQLLIDKLADEMGKILYPVLLIADHSGQVQTIINYEDIQKRWSQAKRQILCYYQGKIAQDAAAQMDVALQHPAHVTEAIKKDWFMSVFFSGINGREAFSFKLHTRFLFPLIAYAPLVQYEAGGNLIGRHTDAKTFVIEYKGTVHEERSAEDIENKNPLPPQEFLFANSTKAAGNLRIRYNMYHKDYSVRSVQATMSLALPKGEKKIRLGIFHQYEKDRPLKEAIAITPPAKKKRKFF